MLFYVPLSGIDFMPDSLKDIHWPSLPCYVIVDATAVTATVSLEAAASDCEGVVQATNRSRYRAAFTSMSPAPASSGWLPVAESQAWPPRISTLASTSLHSKRPALPRPIISLPCRVMIPSGSTSEGNRQDRCRNGSSRTNRKAAKTTRASFGPSRLI
jgi:hypothetical protein